MQCQCAAMSSGDAEASSVVVRTLTSVGAAADPRRGRLRSDSRCPGRTGDHAEPSSPPWSGGTRRTPAHGERGLVQGSGIGRGHEPAVGDAMEQHGRWEKPMSDQQVPEPADLPRTDQAPLPIPAPARLPVTLRRERQRAVARLAARSLINGPVRVASVVGVAAAAAATGAAVAARLLRPRVMEDRPGVPPPSWRPTTADVLRPTVHVSYTRWEIHWFDQP
jgi:hypothetical protein